jgi:hypothetical protein
MNMSTVKECCGCDKASNMYDCPYPICNCCKHSVLQGHGVVTCLNLDEAVVDDDGYCSLYEQEKN